MDDLVMARLAVLKQRHEKQMLAAASEMDQHASHHWERDEDEGRASERMHREDTHHAEHRLHKLPPEDAGAGVKSAEVEPGAAWREVTSGAKWGPLSLEEVRAEQAKFSVERNWTQFHKPRNIMAAFTAEVGELTEGLGLWRDVGFGGEGLTPDEKHHVGEEITDCLVYLLRLADVLDVDLPAAVQEKMAKNNSKYPAKLVYGSSKKYNKY